MSIQKTLIASTAIALFLIGTVSYLVISREHKYPVDENGTKIRLGGIPWDFNNCGGENDPLVITSIVFSAQPERAAPPNDATLTGTFMVHTELKALNVIVKLTGIQVFNSNIPAVGTYDPGDMFTFPYSFQIPGIAPGGAYTLDLKFLNKQNQIISCSNLKMDL